jgi:hypothetical protein
VLLGQHLNFPGCLMTFVSARAHSPFGTKSSVDIPGLATLMSSSSPLWTQEPNRMVQLCVSKGYLVRSATQRLLW